MAIAERIVVNGRELTCFDFPPEATEYTVNVDADGNVKCRRLDGSYLLEHLRQCGEFKCTECLYSYCEDAHVGRLFDCRHPQTLRNKGMKDEDAVMRGCACFWFEPMAKAGERVALRNAEIMDSFRELMSYARDKTESTWARESLDEKRLERITNDLLRNGVNI